MSEEAQKGEEISTDSERIAWHPAFYEAVQMELDEYRNVLQFIAEYPLTTEPLKIDVVVIKKYQDIPIEKNFAAIFKKENILEYKSPDDYISVDDFYQVYSYACIYKVLNKIDIRDMTLTFVGSHFPQKLLSHLQEIRGYTVEEKWPGIYTIHGDILPIQIINSRKLSAEENLWLRDLDNKLEVSDIQRVSAEIERLGKAAQIKIKAYLYVIMKANIESLREALKMSGTMLTLDEVFEEVGLAAKWEARGEARGLTEGEAYGREEKAAEIAKNMLRKNFTIEQTAELSGLDISKVKALSDTL